MFVVEGFADYGNQVAHLVNVVEFRDGRIAKETRYHSAPFDTPEWRARFARGRKQRVFRFGFGSALVHSCLQSSRGE